MHLHGQLGLDVGRRLHVLEADVRVRGEARGLGRHGGDGEPVAMVQRPLASAPEVAGDVGYHVLAGGEGVNLGRCEYRLGCAENDIGMRSSDTRVTLRMSVGFMVKPSQTGK